MMRVLFDNGTPRSLARYLTPHAVAEARVHGWAELTNGELLAAAETAGYDVLITTDKNLRYQQNLRDRRIAIVVLGAGRWSLIRDHAALVLEALRNVTPGSYLVIEFPLPPRQHRGA